MQSGQVTVADLDGLILEIKKKYDEVEAADRIKKDLNIELGSLKGRAAAYLNELKRSSYESAIGKIEAVKEERVNLPESLPDKMAFFDYLKEKGMFENYATVNSNSLNAYYKRERATWIKDGNDPMMFTLPGVPAPKSLDKLEFKETKESKTKTRLEMASTTHGDESL